MIQFKRLRREKRPGWPIRTDVERYLPDYPIVGEGQEGAGFARRPGLLIVVLTLALISGVGIWSFSHSEGGGSTLAKAGMIEDTGPGEPLGEVSEQKTP